MVKISVIIPIYNVEDYLDETLLSLVNQTMIDDIEVLMIDDGSTDDSRYIIEKYALDYDNFHAFHKENQGQGAARNYGVTLAKGKYVHFMDSDDYLPPDAYEKFIKMAEKNNFENDIITGNVLRFRRYNAWDSLLYKNCFKDIKEDIDSTTLDETTSLVWDSLACNKIYRKDFIVENNLKYIENKIYYEDILFTFESFIHADSIAVICDVIYYWRVRREKSSTTQQVSNPKNFMDRLKILNLCLDLIRENNVSEEILHRQYSKWLVNDFKAHLREISSFSNEVVLEIIDELNKILCLIPSEIKDSSTSFSRVLFKMVENKDIDGLMNFAHLEKELKLDPIIPDDLDEKYVEYIDFEKDGMKEDLVAEVFNITNDENNLYMEFTEQINFIPQDNPHKTQAFLIDGADEYELEIKDLENKTIVLPVDLIQDKNHVNIKMIYKTDSYEIESILTSERRNSITFKDFDVDIGIGYNHLMYIDILKKTDNHVEITEMYFDGVNFIAYGESKSEISQMMIQNVLSFNKIFYSVEKLEANKFKFLIPYMDILSAVVKKWELNCVDCLNSIGFEDKFKFHTKNSIIIFTITRNKILITEDIQNPIDGLNQLDDKFEELKGKYVDVKDKYFTVKDKYLTVKDKYLTVKDKYLTVKDKYINLLDNNRQVKWENKKLNKEVNYLNNRVEEFKSRKVVKIADKFKF